MVEMNHDGNAFIFEGDDGKTIHVTLDDIIGILSKMVRMQDGHFAFMHFSDTGQVTCRTTLDPEDFRKFLRFLIEEEGAGDATWYQSTTGYK